GSARWCAVARSARRPPAPLPPVRVAPRRPAKAALALRLRAAPRSWWFLLAPFGTIVTSSPAHPANQATSLDSGRAHPGRRHSVGSGRWQETYGFDPVVPPCVATRPAQIAARGGAATPLSRGEP